MKWQFWKKREPERLNYTASLTAALYAGAEATATSAPLATAALEIASGLFSRSLSASTVKNASAPVVAALTPQVLSLIGRNMIRKEEDFHRIYVRRGRLVLEPVGFSYAQGESPDPDSWIYQITLYGPSGSKHETVSARSILHCRYAVDSSRPWIGVPAWSWSSATGAAIAALETMIANEAKAPHGHLLSIPPQENEPSSDDDDQDPFSAFRNDLSSAKGNTLIVERESTSLRDPGSMSNADSKMDQITYGLDRSLLDILRTSTGRDILAACGVPPTLFVANSDGTAQREAFRRFLHSSLRPLARIVEGELREKLDSPNLTLDLSDLHAADVAGRARAFSQLAKAGIDPDDAALNTGVVVTRPLRENQSPSQV